MTTKSLIGSISVQVNLAVWSQKCQKWGVYEMMLDRLESCNVLRSPWDDRARTFLQVFVEWGCDVGECVNMVAEVVTQSHEGVELADRVWAAHVADLVAALLRDGYTLSVDDMAEVLDLWKTKLALARFDSDPMALESIEDSREIAAMFLEIAAEDDHIVNVDEARGGDEAFEHNVLDHTLKIGWATSETEWDTFIAVETACSDKR